jgi:hypothetical protein
MALIAELPRLRRESDTESRTSRGGSVTLWWTIPGITRMRDFMSSSLSLLPNQRLFLRKDALTGAGPLSRR